MDDLQTQVAHLTKARDEHISQIGDQKLQLSETRTERDFLRHKLNEASLIRSKDLIFI